MRDARREAVETERSGADRRDDEEAADLRAREARILVDSQSREHRDEEAPRPPLTGKAATQERILVAATELFLGRGYERSTIAQIAERAEVSRATVFWHFSDKESLFRECFTRICQPFRESLDRDASELPPEKRLREQVELYQSFVARHRADVDGFLRWALEHTRFRDWLIRTLLDLHHRFGGALTETISEIVPPGHDPHDLAMGILIMLDGGLLISYFDGSPRTAEMRQASIQAILDLIPRRDPRVVGSS